MLLPELFKRLISSFPFQNSFASRFLRNQTVLYNLPNDLLTSNSCSDTPKQVINIFLPHWFLKLQSLSVFLLGQRKLKIIHLISVWIHHYILLRPIWFKIPVIAQIVSYSVRLHDSFVIFRTPFRTIIHINHTHQQNEST